MSSNLYSLLLPTSIEPKDGWTENSRIVFELDHEGKQIRPHTVRFNGILQLFKDATPITATDLLQMDPDAGINSFIKQITTKMNGSTVECINLYNRFVKMSNEAKYFQVEHASSTNALLELMAHSNDGDVLSVDSKCRIANGMLFPIDTGSPSELPFSVDLDIAVNNCDVPLPYSKTGKITIELLLDSNHESGLTSGLNPAVSTFNYKFRNCELRYMSDVEKPQTQPLILTVKSLAHTPSLINKFNSLSFSPSSQFDSVVCSFIKINHIGEQNSKFEYNTLASEAIAEQIDYLEIKQNSQDGSVKFPLVKQTSEILYNALLAWSDNRDFADTSIKQHGMSYNKLAQTVPTGQHIGFRCNNSPAGTKLTVTVNLKAAPPTPYNAYFYTIGRAIL
jgi:hypothetical protein